MALRIERENGNVVSIGNDLRACFCNTYLVMDNKKEALAVSDIMETDNAIVTNRR